MRPADQFEEKIFEMESSSVVLCIWLMKFPGADVDQFTGTHFFFFFSFFFFFFLFLHSCVMVLQNLLDCLALWFSQNRFTSVIFV